MQGEGLLKGDFLRFFLGQTPVDEELMDQRIDEAHTDNGREVRFISNNRPFLAELKDYCDRA